MKTSLFAAVAVCGVLALGACGAPSAPSAGSTSSSSAAASGAGLKAGDQVDAGVLAQRMTAAMQKAGSGTMTLDLAATGAVKGSFVMRNGRMDQSMSMSVQGQNLQIVTVDGILYMKGLPGSTKPWVKIDPKANDPLSKMFAGMAGQMGDPRQLAKALSGTKATVVSSSPGSTVYDVTIDPAKVMAQSTASPKPSMPPVKARYTLDDQDRPTQMSVDVQGQQVTMAFGGWGTPVTVSAPPADQVGTFKVPTG